MPRVSHRTGVRGVRAPTLFRAARVTSRLAMLAFAAVAMAACDDDDATGPSSEFGTYTLTQVNGNPPPREVVNTNSGDVTYVLVWNSGTFELRSDNTWSANIQQTLTVAGAPVNAPGVFAGTYTRNGNNFTFDQEEGPTVTGVLNGNALTATVDLTQLGFPGVATAVFTK